MSTHSPDVFINHVAVALWDVPQASLAPGQLGFLVDNGPAATDADSTAPIGAKAAIHQAAAAFLRE
jgi:hypothetical protein